MKQLILVSLCLFLCTLGLKAESYHGIYRGDYELTTYKYGYYAEDGFFIVYVDARNKATVWLANNDEEDQWVETVRFNVDDEGYGKFKTHNKYLVGCQVNDDGSFTISSLEQDTMVSTSNTERVNWSPYYGDAGRYSVSGKGYYMGSTISVRGEAYLLPDGDVYMYLRSGSEVVMERIPSVSSYAKSSTSAPSIVYTDLTPGRYKLTYDYIDDDGVHVVLDMTQNLNFFDSDADGLCNYVEAYYGTDETTADSDKNRVYDAYEYLADYLGVEDLSDNIPQPDIYSVELDGYSLLMAPVSSSSAMVFCTEDLSELDSDSLQAVTSYLEKKGYLVADDGTVSYSFTLTWDKQGIGTAKDIYGDTLYSLMTEGNKMGLVTTASYGVFDAQSLTLAGMRHEPSSEFGLYKGKVRVAGITSNAYIILNGDGEYILYTQTQKKGYDYIWGQYGIGYENGESVIIFNNSPDSEDNFLAGVSASLAVTDRYAKIAFDSRKSDIETEVENITFSRLYDLYDSDSDGLSNWAESNTYGTNPLLSDSDKDRMSDGAEIEAGTDPSDSAVFPASIKISAKMASRVKLDIPQIFNLYIDGKAYDAGLMMDTKGSLTTTVYLPAGSTYSIYATLSSIDEENMGLKVYYDTGAPVDVALTRNTSLSLVFDGDQDGDGLLDSEEAKYKSDPKLADTDGDGLTDAEEIELKLKPYMADSDNDGYSDYMEVVLGTNPLQKKDAPVAYAQQSVTASLTLIYVDEDGLSKTKVLDTVAFCELLAEIADVENPTGELKIRTNFTEDGDGASWMLSTATGPVNINKYISAVKIAGQKNYFSTAIDEDLITHHIVAYSIENRKKKISLTLIADGDYEYELNQMDGLSLLLMTEQDTPTRVSGIIEHPDYTAKDQAGIIRGSLRYGSESAHYPTPDSGSSVSSGSMGSIVSPEQDFAVSPAM
ncbi:thrombospondin type 3 repeat-containing protein [Ruficoccus sp. ZRK36]|uniref:thrombospondin type 3 repeat-containing protein n=1 Tax=Ruficoccus sp. ZRK36 TaxID=2866311 RepID=UPI001C72C7C7|nr:thrombospondin type 3 repeat-containing protein [Ruficoccus sp. ZRK36]QYY35769.1 thrombospondin type 3 repeat-containing protein [Ruficoccus sp. ZRK36]